MRSTKLSALAGICLFAGVSTAHAVDPNGDYSIRGVGAQTCTTLTQSINTDPANMSLVAASWLMGYMSALNRTQEGTYDVSPVTDPGGMLQLVVGLCGQNPDQLVEAVADSIVRLLAPGRLEASSPLVDTAAGEFTAAVRQNTLARMQVRLEELGYDPGTTDGTFTPETSAAFSSYQAAESLPQTGVADSATIVKLLVPLEG